MTVLIPAVTIVLAIIIALKSRNVKPSYIKVKAKNKRRF